VCLVRDDYILNAVSNKPLINVWSVQRKDQTQLRIVCPGKVTAMCVSPDGLYCVAAVAEKIHVWQLSTGNLLAVLSKHYLAVRCLKFTDDGSHFVSGADDNSVFVWPLARVTARRLDSSGCRPEPRFSWSDHVLPITDIHVGCGGTRAHVTTASRDKTVKIWDLGSGLLLCTLTFSAEVTAVVTDAADYKLFAGTSTGKIFEVNLFDEAVCRSAVSAGEHIPFTGHTGAVTCLSLSLDGATLASGSHDTTVRLWSVHSRQSIKTLHHTDSVTNVLFTLTPAAMLDVDAPRPSLPFCQLKRHLVADEENAEKRDEAQNVINVRLRGHQHSQHIWSKDCSEDIVQLQSSALAANNSDTIAQNLELAKRKNKELYLFAVNKILKV